MRQPNLLTPTATGGKQTALFWKVEVEATHKSACSFELSASCMSGIVVQYVRLCGAWMHALTYYLI